MTNQEVREAPTPATPDIQEATETPEPTDLEEKNTLSEEEAVKLVKEFLESSDVVKAFNALQTIEKKYKANALPENIKNIYVKARNEALNQLKNEPVFKELGGTLDTNSNIGEDISLSGLSEEEADSLVAEILGNPNKLKKQRNVIMHVEEKISIVNEVQRKYYNLVKKETEKEIENDSSFQGKLRKKLPK